MTDLANLDAAMKFLDGPAEQLSRLDIDRPVWPPQCFFLEVMRIEFTGYPRPGFLRRAEVAALTRAV